MIFKTDIDDILKFEEKVNEFDSEKIFDIVKNPFTFTHGIILDESEETPLAVGIVRVVDEFKVILNPTANNITKAKMIKFLIDYGISRMKTNEAVVSITQGGEHYIKMLGRHFKFYKDNGILMRLEK